MIAEHIDARDLPTGTRVFNAVESVLLTYDEICKSDDPLLKPAAFGVAVGLLRERLNITLHAAALLIGGALESREPNRQ